MPFISFFVKCNQGNASIDFMYFLNQLDINWLSKAVKDCDEAKTMFYEVAQLR